MSFTDINHDHNMMSCIVHETDAFNIKLTLTYFIFHTHAMNDVCQQSVAKWRSKFQ